jgi:hypothetical protein
MLIPHISWVFVPASVIPGDLDGLEPASMDEEHHIIGPADRYDVPGLRVPANELQQRGIPELVAQPAAMIIGLSTHEQAMLLRHVGGLWELLLRSRRSPLERYTFRDRPEPRPAATVARPRQYSWW